jgi:integrase
MPKRVPPLSAKTLANIRPSKEPVELVDGFVPGLRVRVYPSGTRSWYLIVRNHAGERGRFHVGTGLSLAEARRKAEDDRKKIRDGANPTAERRAMRQRARAAREGVGTLGALVENYFTTGPGSTLRRARKTKQLIKTVFGKVLTVPLLDVKRPILQLIVDEWPSRHSAALAVRSIRPSLKWAEKREMVQVGISDLEPPAAPRKRERVLTEGEIKAVWPHLQGSHGEVMKWLLWTGCRLNEAAGMTFGEIQADRWTIPAVRSKSKRERVIPLPTQAIALFHSRGGGDYDSLVFPSGRGGALSNWDRITKALQQRSGTSGWHRHDLRRTIATLLGDLGYPPHIISIVLGHANVADGATAIYARSRYQREHKEALQALADAIDRIVTEVYNLVPIAAVG